MDKTNHLLTGLSGMLGMQIVSDIDPTQLEAIFKLVFQLIIGTVTIVPLIKNLFKKKGKTE